MKKLLSLLVCMIVCASPCVADTSPGSADANVRQIQQVIDAFRGGIVAKDRAALLRLPYNENIPFTPVDDDNTLARARTKHPDAKRASPFAYTAFVDYIVSSKERDEEKFSNVQIHTDGLVATIYFDYTFNINDAVTNWGHETWGLIKTDDGWKISSIVWSVSVKA